MWKNTYKDYKPDAPCLKQRVTTGRGIVGCEMQELNGWGNSYQKTRKKKKGFLFTFLSLLFKKQS